ncbi:MAG TPA: histidine phosphatase family protein, partial [Thermoanaerobaculia bacterium]|nr:histidine phosphatase family protein [Thermoanaerobaculia bacterium]
LPALSSLVDAQAGRSFLVVSHKATIRLLLSVFIGFDPRFYRDRLDQSPACLNVLDFRDSSHARLTLFNDVSHYARGAPEVPTAHLSSWWDGAKI